jgi:hypothetical protein
VDDVYAIAGRSLDRAGRIYHSTATITGGPEPDGGKTVKELWIDVRRDVVREQDRHIAPKGGQTSTAPARSLIVGGRRYDSVRLGDPPVPISTCHGGSAAVSVLLGCGEQSVVESRYAGRAVIVLVSSAVSKGEDSTTTSTERVYLDPKSMLPLVGEAQRVIESGSSRHFHSRATIRSEFIDAKTLPSDFFTAEGLATDPVPAAAPASRGQHIYWLGRTSNPGGGLPALILEQTDVQHSSNGDITSLGYSLTQGGPPVVTLHVLPAGASPPYTTAKFVACPGLDHVALELGGTFTVYCPQAGPQGASAPPIPPLALVHLTDALVEIEVEPAIGPNGTIVANAYADPTALSTLIRQLRKR